MKRLHTALLLCAFNLVALAASGAAQTSAQPQQQPPQQHDERVKRLLARADVRAAFDHVERNREAILKEWIAVTEVNAPSGKERERAALVEKILREQKSVDVSYDSAGNLIAVRKGTRGGGPAVVLDAHLDTVFPEGTVIKAEVRDGKIYAPGVGDDTRNIVAMLATLRALDAAKIKTEHDIIFVFTVEEETNFRGVNQFVKDNKARIGHYVALDGGYEGFTYGGIGINWYRHHIVGPGGHTRSRTPPYSATLPMARAIARIYQLPVPDDPPTHINIGMTGGADVVNAKAGDAWFTVDLRSTSNEVIKDLEAKIAAIIKEEAEREKMTVRTERLSSTPAVQVPGHRESHLVKTAEAVHKALGFRPAITVTGSNNSNVALLAGVPAISTGAAPCGDAHALTEWCEIEPFYAGIKKVLLLGVALAELSE